MLPKLSLLPHLSRVTSKISDNNSVEIREFETPEAVEKLLTFAVNIGCIHINDLEKVIIVL